jgi:hypothetical protein
MLFDSTNDKRGIIEGYFSLEEAAGKFSFRLKYLSAMAEKGKLKAFKVSDCWYTSENWINEHKKIIVGLIDKEIDQSKEHLRHLQKWVRKLTK